MVLGLDIFLFRTFDCLFDLVFLEVCKTISAEEWDAFSLGFFVS